MVLFIFGCNTKIINKPEYFNCIDSIYFEKNKYPGPDLLYFRLKIYDSLSNILLNDDISGYKMTTSNAPEDGFHIGLVLFEKSKKDSCIIVSQTITDFWGISQSKLDSIAHEMQKSLVITVLP